MNSLKCIPPTTVGGEKTAASSVAGNLSAYSLLPANRFKKKQDLLVKTLSSGVRTQVTLSRLLAGSIPQLSECFSLQKGEGSGPTGCKETQKAFGPSPGGSRAWGCLRVKGLCVFRCVAQGRVC